MIALASVALTLAVSILGSYAIARLRFFGRRQVNFLFLSVYLFPILLAIPLFVFFTRIGLRGSLFGLVLVYASQIVRSPSTCCATTSRRCPRAWRRRPPWTGPAA